MASAGASVRAPVAPLFSFPFVLNPEPTLAWLRAQDPVHTLPGTELVVLTRYADCAAALNHPDLSAAGGQEERSRASGAPPSMLNRDGGDHARLRRPGSALLGPAAVRRTEPARRAAIGAILDGLGERADLSTEVARPIATAALAGVLGIRDVARFGELAADVEPALDPTPSPQVAQRGQEGVARLHAFAEPLLLAAEPGSPLHALANDPEITRADALGIISLATIGGWGPLAELTTVVVHHLLTLPSWSAMAGDPQWREAFVEDATRWHTPIPFVARRALVDVQVPSGVVPAGRQVLIHIGSADRDPDRFEAPNAVLPQRDRLREHLAYGGGPHFCLGAALIRATVPAVIELLAERFPAARLRAATLVWQPQVFPRRPFSSTVELLG